MFSLLTIGGPNSIALVTRVRVGTIDSHNRNADGSAAVAPELCSLIQHVRADSIDLLNHCLSKYLYLHTDFNGGNLPQGDFVFGQWLSSYVRNSFAERTISSAECFPDRPILAVYNVRLRAYSCGE